MNANPSHVSLSAASVAQPWLSVLMPTYNGVIHLEETLGSIATQSDPGEFEIIAVDDGSTDRTCDILEAFAERLPMAVHRLQHRGNWVANTNVALEMARGRYITILHQDDRWVPERLSTLRRLTRQRPDIILFSHAIRFIDACGRYLGTGTNPLPASPPSHSGLRVAERLLIQNWMALPAPVFSREAALSVGVMDTALLYSADWDLWLKLINRGETYYNPQPLADVRVHSGTQTVSISSDPEIYRRELRTVFDRHMSRWEERLQRGALVRKVGLCSIELNCALADAFHRRPVRMVPLFCKIAALGPRGWYRLWRDSRISQRGWPRLRLHRDSSNQDG